MPKIYQLKVSLVGSRPPIWRRVLVNSNTKLPALHAILQIAMGWTDSHLHAFHVDRFEIYSTPNPDFDDGEFKDETKVGIDRLLRWEGESLVYEYDFGDSWDHKVLLEKVIPLPQALPSPICIKGKNACPPEDSGGIYGYGHLVSALTDPAHPEHEEMKAYYGDSFAPVGFDIDDITRRLLACFEK